MFKIHRDADADNFTIDANGNIAINSEAAQLFNELEVFGNDSSDTAAAIAVTPDPGSNLSARIRVDTGANEFAISTRGPTGEYSKPLVIDLEAPSSSIAISADGNVIIQGGVAIGSSRDIKHAFKPVEPHEVLKQLLRIPITEWSYRTGESNIRHLGPVSEDFSAAFGVGRDNKHVSPVDLSGVAFAAIQGLHQVVLNRDTQIEDLRRSHDAEINDLRRSRDALLESHKELRQSRDEMAARLEALEKLVTKQIVKM